MTKKHQDERKCCPPTYPMLWPLCSAPTPLMHLPPFVTYWATSAISPCTLGVPKEVLRARHVSVLHLEDGARTPILASGWCLVVLFQRGFGGTLLFQTRPRNTIASGALATVVPFALHRPGRQIFDDTLVRLEFSEQIGRTPFLALLPMIQRLFKQ